MKNSKQNTNINIKKITLPDGFQVGIMNLDDILQEVADLELNDKKSIEKEIIDRVKTCNYVAPGAEREYIAALVHEYQKKYFPEEVSHSFDPKKPHAG